MSSPLCTTPWSETFSKHSHHSCLVLFNSHLMASNSATEGELRLHFAFWIAKSPRASNISLTPSPLDAKPIKPPQSHPLSKPIPSVRMVSWRLGHISRVSGHRCFHQHWYISCAPADKRRLLPKSLLMDCELLQPKHRTVSID
jgi:hypothetical protein